MTTPAHPITDDAVRALPVRAGRAELLDEIVRTPAARSAEPRPPRGRTWLVPVAAAAAVAVLATVPLWSRDDPGTRGSVAPAAPSTPTPTPAAADRVILDAPGWTVRTADADGGAHYSSGDAEVEVMTRPASLHQSYVEDRAKISGTRSDGTPVEAAGRAGRMWAYGADDHTAILEPAFDVSIEVRGQGLDEAAFLTVLGELRAVDRAAFEASLPASFVTGAERQVAIDEVLTGIAAELAPDHGLAPAGQPDPQVASEQPDRYQLGAEVSAAVACPWIASYVDGRASGRAAQVADAVAAMDTSRRWPILREMRTVGEYPDVVWEYATSMRKGQDVEGYRDGLGCP